MRAVQVVPAAPGGAPRCESCRVGMREERARRFCIECRAKLRDGKVSYFRNGKTRWISRPPRTN
jgi:hypothetical protein